MLFLLLVADVLSERGVISPHRQYKISARPEALPYVILFPFSVHARQVGRAPLNQRQALTFHLEDAAVPLDNNASEREMKRVVLNRKNSPFVGNERGGRTAAILSSFTITCRRLSIDTQLYLRQLITYMPVIKSEVIDLCLPDIWKQRLELASL